MKLKVTEESRGLLVKPKILAEEVIDEERFKELYCEYESDWNYHKAKLEAYGFTGECVGQNKYMRAEVIKRR